MSPAFHASKVAFTISTFSCDIVRAVSRFCPMAAGRTADCKQDRTDLLAQPHGFEGFGVG